MVCISPSKADSSQLSYDFTEVPPPAPFHNMVKISHHLLFAHPVPDIVQCTRMFGSGKRYFSHKKTLHICKNTRGQARLSHRDCPPSDSVCPHPLSTSEMQFLHCQIAGVFDEQCVIQSFCSFFSYNKAAPVPPAAIFLIKLIPLSPQTLIQRKKQKFKCNIPFQVACFSHQGLGLSLSWVLTSIKYQAHHHSRTFKAYRVAFYTCIYMEVNEAWIFPVSHSLYNGYFKNARSGSAWFRGRRT